MTWLTPRTHPIRFLLYLEWSLLFIVFASEALRGSIFHVPRSPTLNLLCLLGFTLLGLALPQKKIGTKIAYTVFEFVPTLLATVVGGLRLFPLLYVVLVMRNSLIFQGKSRLVITGITYCLFLITQANRYYTFAQNSRFRDGLIARQLLIPERILFLNLTFALLFALVLIFSHLSITAILAERHRRQELASANQKLRLYALQAKDMAMLTERNRVAREIHDSLGHSLITFNLYLEAALRLLATEPKEARELLQEAQQLAKTALGDVRQSVKSLRSDPLGERSLEEAIRGLIEEFKQATGIEPETSICIDQPIPKELNIAVYRLTQEALVNVIKYAEATTVKLSLTTQWQLELSVKDNGKGFRLNENQTGFGLQGMRERTSAFGGQLKLITAPGQACEIIATFPL